MSKNNKIKTLKKDISVIFKALRYKKTPIYVKLLAILTIVYAISPVDIVSDVLGLVGIVDDVVVIAILITIIKKLIPSDVLDDNSRN